MSGDRGLLRRSLGWGWDVLIARARPALERDAGKIGLCQSISQAMARAGEIYPKQWIVFVGIAHGVV